MNCLSDLVQPTIQTEIILHTMLTKVIIPKRCQLLSIININSKATGIITEKTNTINTLKHTLVTNFLTDIPINLRRNNKRVTMQHIEIKIATMNVASGGYPIFIQQ